MDKSGELQAAAALSLEQSRVFLLSSLVSRGEVPRKSMDTFGKSKSLALDGTRILDLPD
jgi:hypothetical protein